MVLIRHKRTGLGGGCGGGYGGSHQSLSWTKATMLHQGSIPTSQVVESVVEEHFHKTVFHSFVLKSEMRLSSAGD